MICPKCGNILPNDARFCNNCGSTTSKFPPSEPKGKPKQVKTKVEYKGRPRKKAGKVVAAFAALGGTIALLWTPIIRPVLMSKTIGPQDTTEYKSELKDTKSVTDAANFPNGKWVREDGKAVLYIAHMENEETFQFELFAKGENEEKSCELKEEALVDKDFTPNTDIKATAYYKSKEEDSKEEGYLNFAAFAKEEAIQITSEQSFIDSHINEALPDGIYYRIHKVWFWDKEESGKWSLEFIPDKEVPEENKQTTPEKEIPVSTPTNTIEYSDGGLVVAPPPIPKDGKTPKRVSGGREYLSAEQMEILHTKGFYVKFDGAYIVTKADVYDHNKYFDYHYNVGKDAFKNNCNGTQEGMRLVQARYDSMVKIEDSLYGATRWDFSSKVDFMPEFAGAWLEHSGKFATDVKLANTTHTVGYEVNEIDVDTSSSENGYFETNWSSKDPYVYNVRGGWSYHDDMENLVDTLEYDLNLYFYADGTVDAEGFMTLTGKGTEYIRYWIQMSATEFQVQKEYEKYFDFKAIEYLYSFETLDEDIPEFYEERETAYIATGDNYKYRKYEYEKTYQTVD